MFLYKTLGYASGMDQLRKALGRRIYRARRKAGYRSQRAFADAIGVSEASVANAERGSSSVGDSVFTSIEDGLHWPEDCIRRYLETGAESELPLGDQPQPAAAARELTPEEARNLLRARLAAVLAVHPEVHEMLEEKRAEMDLLDRTVQAVPDDALRDLLTDE